MRVFMVTALRATTRDMIFRLLPIYLAAAAIGPAILTVGAFLLWLFR